MLELLKKFLFNFNKQDSQWKGSQEYWNNRYKSGGNSGAGSYNRLAIFKAHYLNSFIKENKIQTVIEWGCGDGNQLSLANYPNYIGFDVSKKAIQICKKKFKQDQTKKFIYSGSKNFSTTEKAELALSLDVIYHLIEDDIFNSYMQRLFDSASKYVIIYSCNDNKIVTDVIHVKHRIFTQWISKNISSNWNLKETVKNKYPFDINDPNNTSWSDFFIYEKK